MGTAKKKIKPIDWTSDLQRENVRVEWKENVADERGVVKTLCAFANDIQQVGGGRVICGLKEEKNETGKTIARVVGLDEKRFKEIKNKVEDICHRFVEPPLMPTVSEYPVEGDPSRRILIFEIAASPQAHRYRIKDQGTQYYVRINDKTRPADGLISILLEQKKIWPSYLDQTHPEGTIDDIDRFALKEFLGEMDLPLPLERYLDVDTRLRGDVPSLVTSPPGRADIYVPRNFALLLFGREPHRFFRGAYAILSIYQGEDKASDRSQRYEIFGPIPLLIRSILDKLQVYMGIDIDKTVDILTGSQNRSRYSSRAIREAVVNAFVHRDYHSHEPVRVVVFNDRIEITNPGGLYNGLDLEKVKTGQAPPSWRNPSLAWFMVALDLAENEGQGIRTIVEKTKKITGIPPEFRISANWFTIVIPALVQKEIRRAAPVIEKESGKEGLILVSIGGDSIEKQVEKSLNFLELEDTEIAVNFVSPAYVDAASENWEKIAEKLKKEIQQVVDSPDYRRFHLFYRGPGVFAPLLGALIGQAKRLALYTYENGRYFYTYTIDRKFLKG